MPFSRRRVPRGEVVALQARVQKLTRQEEADAKAPPGGLLRKCHAAKICRIAPGMLKFEESMDISNPLNDPMINCLAVGEPSKLVV